MLIFVIICILVFLILVLSEFLWRKKILPIEFSRKLVHIFTGVIVAFLSFFTNYRNIQLLALAFLLVILISLKFNIFRSIHSVKRVTVGEVLYAVGIGVCALIEPANWVFVVAILHLALADAIAAMVGVRWGYKTSYKIFGHKKSWHGSLTFLATSILIMTGLLIFGPQSNYGAVYLLVLTPVVLTLVENLAIKGIDNVAIPLVVVVLLSNF